MSLVKHKRGTQSAYDGKTMAENVIYFITDTKRIYQNGVKFAGYNQWGGGDSNYCSLTIDGSSKNVVLDNDQVFRSRGKVTLADFINKTYTTANSEGYVNLKTGLYSVTYSGASGFLMYFHKSGSASGLMFYKDYQYNSSLRFRGTIDSNRHDGDWRVILDSRNYTEYVYNKSTSDGRFAPINLTNANLPTRLRTLVTATSPRQLKDIPAESGFYYINTGDERPSGMSDASILNIAYSSTRGHQLLFKFGGTCDGSTEYDYKNMYLRGNNNGTWTAWNLILSVGNYNQFIYSKSQTDSAISASHAWESI